MRLADDWAAGVSLGLHDHLHWGTGRDWLATPLQVVRLYVPRREPHARRAAVGDGDVVEPPFKDEFVVEKGCLFRAGHRGRATPIIEQLDACSEGEEDRAHL